LEFPWVGKPLKFPREGKGKPNFGGKNFRAKEEPKGKFGLGLGKLLEREFLWETLGDPFWRGILDFTTFLGVWAPNFLDLQLGTNLKFYLLLTSLKNCLFLIIGNLGLELDSQEDTEQPNFVVLGPIFIGDWVSFSQNLFWTLILGINCEGGKFLEKERRGPFPFRGTISFGRNPRFFCVFNLV